MKPINIRTDRGNFTAQLTGERGDWVICWPAQLGDAQGMHDFARMLSRNFRVVLCDPPAMGLNRHLAYTHSLPNLVYFANCVMQQLGIERCHWVGHSAGGVVGVAVHNTLPKRIHSLTLASTPMLSQGRFKLHAAATTALLSASRVGRHLLALQGVAETGYANKHEKSYVVAYLRKVFEQCDHKAIRNMRPLEGSVVRGEFDKLRINPPPMLILCGIHDPIVLARDQRTVAEITHSQFAQLSCGHMSLLIQPEHSAHAFTRFVNSIGPGQPVPHAPAAQAR